MVGVSLLSALESAFEAVALSVSSTVETPCVLYLSDHLNESCNQNLHACAICLLCM